MSSEHVEVLREMKGWRMPPIGGSAYNAALDAAIASLSAQQTPAEAQPVAWMDPDTEDVIHDMRKTSWSSDYGVGGEKKARTYTTPLYANPPPSAPVGVVDVDALAQEIRRVDGDHNLGAGALAEALMPYLAQQPATTLPNEDDSDLTVAYMAGRHDGRKEAQQPAAVDEAMVERALQAWFETDDWVALLSGIEPAASSRSRMRAALTAASQAGRGPQR